MNLIVALSEWRIVSKFPWLLTTSPLQLQKVGRAYISIVIFRDKSVDVVGIMILRVWALWGYNKGILAFLSASWITHIIGGPINSHREGGEYFRYEIDKVLIEPLAAPPFPGVVGQ